MKTQKESFFKGKEITFADGDNVTASPGFKFNNPETRENRGPSRLTNNFNRPSLVSRNSIPLAQSRNRKEKNNGQGTNEFIRTNDSRITPTNTGEAAMGFQPTVINLDEAEIPRKKARDALDEILYDKRAELKQVLELKKASQSILESFGELNEEFKNINQGYEALSGVLKNWETTFRFANITSNKYGETRDKSINLVRIDKNVIDKGKTSDL